MSEDKHFLHSSLREEYVEYIFLSKLCSYGWSQDRFVEVARAHTSAHGYDLILSCENVTRHVLLKSSLVDATTNHKSVNLALTKKPSGCVIWLKIDPNSLDPVSFGWLGSRGGKPLSDLGDRVTKRTTPNSSGDKPERKASRDVTWGRFTKLTSIEMVFSNLFDTSESED